MLIGKIKLEMSIFIMVKYRGAAHCLCNLLHKKQKEISIVFHNGSNYDYHFMIKELAQEFQGQTT